MWLTLDDLRCESCGAYVHPLLNGCPACGASHASRLQDAAAGPIGATRLAEAPETQRIARNLTTRYTMKVNAVGSSAADATLVDAVTHLANALTYRVSGDAISKADDASVSLRDGALVIQRRPSGALLGEIPVRAIVASVARHGEVTLFHVARAGDRPGAPIGAPATDGLARITLANRGGMLAARARDDHYQSLACWLGVLAAAAAERRWTEVGLPGYLAELGLAPDGTASAASERDHPAAPAAVPPDGATPAVQASLVELEGLRAAGLVGADEYAAKRREILARL